jgi:hypothetical protein
LTISPLLLNVARLKESKLFCNEYQMPPAGTAPNACANPSPPNSSPHSRLFSPRWIVLPLSWLPLTIDLLVGFHATE